MLSSGKKAFTVQKGQTDLGLKGDSAVFGFFCFHKKFDSQCGFFFHSFLELDDLLLNMTECFGLEEVLVRS